MRTIKIAFILISMQFVLACNQPGKTPENSAPGIRKQSPEKAIVSKPDHIEPKELNTKELNTKELNINELLVKEILTTCPRYRQLTKGLRKAVIKNGGQSFGVRLEGSPNPKKDKAWSYSKTYDYTIYEMYPNRQLNIARFSFNPKNNQLYEYDAVLDQLQPIVFNRNLLIQSKTP